MAELARRGLDLPGARHIDLQGQRVSEANGETASEGEGTAPVPSSLGPGRALLVFAAYLGVKALVWLCFRATTTVYVFASTGSRDPGLDADAWQAVVIPAEIAGIVIGGVVAFRLTKRSLRGTIQSGTLVPLGWTRAAPRHLAVAALAGLGLSLVYVLGVLTLLTPPGTALIPQQELPPLLSAPLAGGWQLYGWTVMVLLVAVVDEFVYRGVMFTGFCRYWSRRSAAIFVTALFVVMQAPYALGLIAAAVVGTAALVARMTTRSLIPAIALRASYNLGMAVAPHALVP